MWKKAAILFLQSRGSTQPNLATYKASFYQIRPLSDWVQYLLLMLAPDLCGVPLWAKGDSTYLP